MCHPRLRSVKRSSSHTLLLSEPLLPSRAFVLFRSMMILAMITDSHVPHNDPWSLNDLLVCDMCIVPPPSTTHPTKCVTCSSSSLKIRRRIPQEGMCVTACFVQAVIRFQKDASHFGPAAGHRASQAPPPPGAGRPAWPQRIAAVVMQVPRDLGKHCGGSSRFFPSR